MVVDTSALVSIRLQEDVAQIYADAIARIGRGGPVGRLVPRTGDRPPFP